jgi:1,4-dihydroxy-6-naphthoate synthase
MNIRLAVSPDADDLFMVRALLDGLIPTGPYTFQITNSPTDALNAIASGAEDVDVCAISIAHYPRVQARYRLLAHGGSMGDGYGPVVVARGDRPLSSLTGAKLAVPGLTTSAWLVFRLLFPDVHPEPVVIPIEPYARVFEALDSGAVDAALVIHEGRLTYEDRGLVRLAELGEEWARQTGGLPLPLGGNAIRRSLAEHVAPVSALLQASVAHALADREAAIQWLLARGGALRTRERVDRYLGMYANHRTLDYAEDGRRAIHHLFRWAEDRGLLPTVPTVDFA